MKLEYYNKTLNRFFEGVWAQVLEQTSRLEYNRGYYDVWRLVNNQIYTQVSEPIFRQIREQLENYK